MLRGTESSRCSDDHEISYSNETRRCIAIATEDHHWILLEPHLQNILSKINFIMMRLRLRVSSILFQYGFWLHFCFNHVFFMPYPCGCSRFIHKRSKTKQNKPATSPLLTPKWDFNFSRRWILRLRSSGIRWGRVVWWLFIFGSEKHTSQY